MSSFTHSHPSGTSLVRKHVMQASACYLPCPHWTSTLPKYLNEPRLISGRLQSRKKNIDGHKKKVDSNCTKTKKGKLKPISKHWKIWGSLLWYLLGMWKAWCVVWDTTYWEWIKTKYLRSQSWKTNNTEMIMENHHHMAEEDRAKLMDLGLIE